MSEKDGTCLHFIQFVFCSQYRDCFRYLHREHVITEHKGEVWNKYLSLNVERMREKQTDTTFFNSKNVFYSKKYVIPCNVGDCIVRCT